MPASTGRVAAEQPGERSSLGVPGGRGEERRRRGQRGGSGPDGQRFAHVGTRAVVSGNSPPWYPVARGPRGGPRGANGGSRGSTGRRGAGKLAAAGLAKPRRLPLRL